MGFTKKLTLITTLWLCIFIYHTSLAQDTDPNPDNSTTYNPSIHYYRGDINDINSGNVSIGVLPVTPLAVESSGGWFYPSGVKSTWRWPNNVRSAACGGGQWVDYYYIDENILWSGNIHVWSNNVLNQLHISNYGGLYGGYYCVGGLCTISVCAKSGVGFDPSVTFISWN